MIMSGREDLHSATPKGGSTARSADEAASEKPLLLGLKRCASSWLLGSLLHCPVMC